MRIGTHFRTLAAAAMLGVGLAGFPSVHGSAMAAIADPPATIARVARPTTASPHPAGTITTELGHVSLGATGQGPATQNECDTLEDLINDWVDEANQNQGSNSPDANARDAAIYAGWDDVALEDGCFIVH